jgi:membrane protein DedA with SNARE-associated domain
MTAGATGFHQRRFVFFSIIAGISWSLYSVGIGALAGQWFHDHSLLAAGLAIVIALAMGLVVDHGLKLLYKRKVRKSHEAEDAASTTEDSAAASKGARARTGTPVSH